MFKVRRGSTEGGGKGQAVFPNARVWVTLCPADRRYSGVSGPYRGGICRSRCRAGDGFGPTQAGRMIGQPRRGLIKRQGIGDGVPLNMPAAQIAQHL
jgi:hypothetical protein